MAREFTRPVYLYAVISHPTDAGRFITTQFREGNATPDGAIHVGSERECNNGSIILNARNGWVAAYSDDYDHDQPESRLPAEQRRITGTGNMVNDPELQSLRKYSGIVADTNEIATRSLPWEK